MSDDIIDPATPQGNAPPDDPPDDDPCTDTGDIDSAELKGVILF